MTWQGRGKWAVAALLLCLSLLAPLAGAAPPGGRLIPGAEETVLRLHDLPPGYVIDGNSGCDTVELTRVREYSALDRWIVKNRPGSCEFEYESRFQVPGLAPAPPQVKGETINTPSKQAVTEGWSIFRRLIRRDPHLKLRGRTSIGPDGPQALLLRQGRTPASILWWHYGKLLALVEATGLNAHRTDEAALYYAQIQQQRLEAPTPYTEAERDDTEVELDNPALELPVYWLGRTFEGDLGSAELQTAVTDESDGLPGVGLELRYDGFNLETWTIEAWKRFQASYFRKINHPRCTRTVAFEWGQGHAVISAGYRRRTFEEGCPRYPPTRYWAAAHIGGVVVGVNETTCRCLSPGFGPYSESLRGIKTILRSLVLRPKPVFAP